MSHSLRENECHKLTISEYIFIALCAQDHVILAQRFLHSLYKTKNVNTLYRSCREKNKNVFVLNNLWDKFG